MKPAGTTLMQGKVSVEVVRRMCIASNGPNSYSLSDDAVVLTRQ
jgi:hypothetical protein